MKFEYELTQQDDYTDISVYFDDGDESWCMDISRDMVELTINPPAYQYSRSSTYNYEPIAWDDLPERVQQHFNKYLRRAKTILILGGDK
jgi:hypothetical protein